MAIQLARLDHITVRRTTPRRTPGGRTATPIRTAAGAVVRSLLIGVGIGVTLSLGHPGGVVGIATVGVLAIGAALTSWDT
jgi:hypothetical protein